MFRASGRYLQRNTDYRSVLGRIIREHLGATQSQLDRIIPGYASSADSLASKGVQSRDNTAVIGEPDVI
jgi:mannitol-1-phosphate/altronate dehydrogenase